MKYGGSNQVAGTPAGQVDLVRPPGSMGWRPAVTPERSAPASRDDLGPGILPEDRFLRCLRFEKRRSDRSGAPLSMVLVDVGGAVGVLTPAAQYELMKVLVETKRDTDIVGYLPDGKLGVMLLDTDAEGLQLFARKVQAASGELGSRVASATYPGDLFERIRGSVDGPVESPFADEPTPHARTDSIAKRLVDVIGALAALMLASPVMVATAIAVRLSSPGPVIFRQQRIGKGGVPFTFYKFRSMRAGADDRLHREYVGKLIDGNVQAVNQGDTERPHFKIKADPRVTVVGRFIRRTSIDELPQLYNVLKGDMSLVGPRPPLPYETERYKPWHLRRVLEVRPGITGLWQVEGRNKTSFDDMVRLDLRYVRDWSPTLDIRILLKTIFVVLHGRGDE